MYTTNFNRRRNRRTKRALLRSFYSMCIVLCITVLLSSLYFKTPSKALEVVNDEKSIINDQANYNSSNLNHENPIYISDVTDENGKIIMSLYKEKFGKYMSSPPGPQTLNQKVQPKIEKLNIETTVDKNKEKQEKEKSETKKEEVESQPTVVEQPQTSSGYTILKTYDVPAGHPFKSYTNYKLLSSSSPQGKLQQQAHTDPSSGIRMVDDYYCAALGTYYDGSIGDKFLVTLSTGKQFKMILCDVKSDRHTNSTHQYTAVNGCVIEFYVDYNVMSSYVKRMGNISYVDGFAGDITCIQKIQG